MFERGRKTDSDVTRYATGPDLDVVAELFLQTL